ncbi:putative pectate lyase P59 [Camellia lanceoleosa]|uniref:Pectate lyase P59 n=1 Tax=Camellia lanceoleosa TaxID=1840588 RepID=A0ACC0I568_9ERIC|nr:putative pectate lyase P59 [Camellia lanceoleosa]
MANIGQFDKVWQRQAEEVKEATLNSYESDPSIVTDSLNKEVHWTLKSIKLTSNATMSSDIHLTSNNTRSTRRYLKGKQYGGPCLATIPIDRCWRCQPHWHLNRKRLANCVLGFGYKTTGGKAGKFYVVTDNLDDSSRPKPRSLRHAALQKEPLWIIFARNMNIRLTEELIMQGDKTIDGCGARVNIIGGAGITIQFIKNVIIHNLHIRNIVSANGGNVINVVDHIAFRARSDGDGISIYGSSNVWIDHVSMSNCVEDLIDAIEGSTTITISNSHFTDYNEKSLHVDVSKTQLFEKVRRLKKKYENNASKSKMGEDRTFSKAHEQKTYELLKKIWFGGANSVGVDSAKVNGKTRKNQSQRAIVASPRD